MCSEESNEKQAISQCWLSRMSLEHIYGFSLSYSDLMSTVVMCGASVFHYPWV